MSERVMIRGIEGPIKRLMETVGPAVTLYPSKQKQTSPHSNCVQPAPVSRNSLTQVEKRVRRQPGLLSYKTLVDCDKPNNYCVLTKWKSEVPTICPPHRRTLMEHTST